MSSTLGRIRIAKSFLLVGFGLSILSSANAADDAEDALWAAARKGDLAAVKSAIERGVPVDAKTRHGVTALFYAAQNGHLDVVRYLAEKGADVSIKDTFYGMSGLGRAADQGHADVVRFLLEKGAAGVDGALASALNSDHAEVVRVLLASGKVTDKGKSEVMQMAIAEKKTAMIELLEKAGVKKPEPVKFVSLDAEQLNRVIGRYRGPRENEIELKIDGGKLVGVAGGPPFTLGAVDANTFQLENMPAITIRVQSEGGKVTGIELEQGDNRTVFKKVQQ